MPWDGEIRWCELHAWFYTFLDVFITSSLLLLSFLHIDSLVMRSHVWPRIHIRRARIGPSSMICATVKARTPPICAPTMSSYEAYQNITAVIGVQSSSGWCFISGRACDAAYLGAR